MPHYRGAVKGDKGDSAMKDRALMLHVIMCRLDLVHHQIRHLLPPYQLPLPPISL